MTAGTEADDDDDEGDDDDKVFNALITLARADDDDGDFDDSSGFSFNIMLT